MSLQNLRFARAQARARLEIIAEQHWKLSNDLDLAATEFEAVNNEYKLALAMQPNEEIKKTRIEIL